MSNIKNVLRDIDQKTRFESQRKMVGRFSKFFGPDSYGSINRGYGENIDDYVDLISKAKKTDAYVARTLTSILQQSLKNGWFFDSVDPVKSKRIEKRFNQLLFDSNMNPRSFVRSVLKNYIDYSNVFIHKTYKPVGNVGQKRISALTLFPSKGWHVAKTKGPFVLEWYFYYQSGAGQQSYTAEQVYHLSYNKEVHEVYGTPFILSVLEDVQLLRDLEGASIEDFYKQLQKRTVVYVGNDQRPGTSKEINELSSYLNSLGPEDDLVLSGRCEVDLIEPTYNEPELIMTSMKNRIFAGLMASETQMGISGAGRQDADTQASREAVTVEEFQENLEDQINNTIIRELCLEEFGRYDHDTAVFIKFGKAFDQSERNNNHWMNLYQSGAIDFEELRSKIQLPSSDYDEEKTFEARKHRYELDSQDKSHINQKELIELQGKIQKQVVAARPTTSSTSKSSTSSKPKGTATKKSSGAANTVKSKSQPTNQHGTKSSSKKSVKDSEEE